MFENFFAPSLDFSNFDTRNVTNMSVMFSYNGLEIFDLSSFDTSNVTNMRGMFCGATITTIDLTHFDTSNVIDMSLMFANVSEINTSITIMNPKTIHEEMFVYSGGEIILNYTESTSSLVDDMINFAYESNVIKGELIN